MLISRAVRQLTLGLAGAACAVTVTSPALGSSAQPAAASAPAPGMPRVFYGDWLVPGKAVALGVFSSATGRLKRIIVPPRAGGGVGLLALAAGGKSIAFEAGNGTCGSLIESVSAKGSPIKVVVPDGTGHGGTPSFGPSYSADGRYFSYGTLYCDNSDTFLHIRNLKTRRTSVYRTKDGITGLVFLGKDKRVAFLNDWHLVVANLPSLTSHSYPPPDGCRYYDLAGTATKLVAAMVCGRHLRLSLVTLSTTTFRPVGKPLGLGRCKLPDSLSVAPTYPSARLLEVTLGCHNGPTADPKAALLEISGRTVRELLSGKFAFLPGDSVW